MKTVVLIPARLGSSRLPEKVILDICGKPMVQHVYEVAKKAKSIDDVYISTDSLKVKEICESFTNNIIMTDENHQSGTDRIAQAVEDIDCDFVINVQGDEPLMDYKLIDELALILQHKNLNMVSAMHRIDSVDDLVSPNSVKVIVDKNSDAIYFSRSIIPYNRDEQNSILENTTIPSIYSYYKHIGIYGYLKNFLKDIVITEQTKLEKSEKLEQLRVLENGYKIHMIKTDYVPVGVDVQEDLEKVREMLINA